jgi:hypothetical protein
MNSAIELLRIQVPLTWSAHRRAQQFAQCQTNSQKAKQVYLNTLAIYAVDFHLQCLGFETDLNKSESTDAIMQMLLDVADLEVKNLGRIECRPVLPNQETVEIPADVWEDRIAYIAVQLNESLTEATLLGFLETATLPSVALSNLESLENLPTYLNQYQSVESAQQPVKLAQWFEGIIEAGWQSIETLFGTPSAELALSFRSTSLSGVKRCKLVELGNPNRSVSMVVTLIPESEQQIDILVEVWPRPGQIYLPSNLQLMLLDEVGEMVMDVQARNENRNIQLEFSGEIGDTFSVKMALGDVSVKEDFVL